MTPPIRTLLLASLFVAACATPPLPVDRAQDSAASFRAVGNEPGWHVDIYADHLTFVTNYGEDRYTFTDYTVSGRMPYVYRATSGDHAIMVTLADVRCFDDMSGERFETTVTLDFDGQIYRGCGRALD